MAAAGSGCRRERRTLMTNEVLQTIKSRRTVRAYRPDAVPEELLQAVLELIGELL